MIKQFYDNEAAREYVKWNGLPYSSICRGRGGKMNAVEINNCGGRTTIKSSNNIKAHGLRRYQQATA